jgi:cell division septation protein DedD
MIRINLLKPLEAPVRPLVFEAPAKSNRGKVIALLAVGAAALIAIVALQFPGLFGGLFAKHEEPVAAAPEPPAPKPESEAAAPPKVTANAVEETVRDLNPEASKPAPPAGYAGLVPSQKIEFQYYASARILKDIKSITPPDVGFANFIFTPPGEFYVHGLAADEADLKRFQDGLASLAGAEIKPGMNAPAGARGRAKEFSFFGTVRYPVESLPSPPDRVMTKADLPKQLQQMKTVAGNLGIRLKEPKLLATAQAGNVKKMVWAASADCSFQQMQDFLAELHQSNSNLGFAKFALRARGDEKVVADMDILAYVEP